MNERQRARAEELYLEALERPAPDRASWVRGACGEDAEVLQEVLSLLESAEGADGYFAALAGAAGAPRSVEEDGDPTGSADAVGAGLDGATVGPYRLLRELGRGGAGTVYLAERADGQFEQQVAIKLLRRGLDTDDILARFRAERQILASLNHPHIARLFDGGATAEGRPYLVMEPVEGVPITEHCDLRRCTVEERLRLFVQVARAVQYAHGRLVVHRDIKPSNILVAEDGTPKLLDFGIAKLLDDAADAKRGHRTRTGVRLLTPEYASPEQVRGEAVGTASDAYQLGILLYRLLCGRRPWRGRGVKDLERRVTGEAPTAPSAAVVQGAGAEGPAAEEVARLRSTDVRRLRARLRGDLDTIVFRAIRAEPERRYATAAELADDVERYLAGQPVAARPDTWGYRTRKLVARRPGAVAAAALAVLAVATYSVTVTLYAERLEAERNLARAESLKATQVQRFITDLFQTADPIYGESSASGSDLTVREALDLGVRRLRAELHDQPEMQAALLGTIAGVYASLELLPEALELREEAIEIERRVWGERSPQVAATLERIGNVHWIRRSYDEAERFFRQYAELATEVHGEGSPENAKGLARLGSAFHGRGEVEQAEGFYLRAAALYREAGPGYEEELASALTELGQLYQLSERPREAETAAREAFELRERALGAEHPRTAVSLTALAVPLRHLGRQDEAEAAMRRALAVFENRLGSEHSYTTGTLNNLANVVAQRGDVAEAASIHRRLLETRRARLGSASPETVRSMQNLATMLTRLGQYDEAITLAREAHEGFARLLGPGHLQTALPLLTLSQIHLEQRDWNAAAATAERARLLLGNSLPSEHYIVGVAEGRLGRALAGLQRPAEAEALLRGSLRKLAASDSDTRSFVDEMTEALEALRAR